jgi:hypothetical protein
LLVVGGGDDDDDDDDDNDDDRGHDGWETGHFLSQKCLEGKCLSLPKSRIEMAFLRNGGCLASSSGGGLCLLVKLWDGVETVEKQIDSGPGG